MTGVEPTYAAPLIGLVTKTHVSSQPPAPLEAKYLVCDRAPGLAYTELGLMVG